jgi:hypothetical protein
MGSTARAANVMIRYISVSAEGRQLKGTGDDGDSRRERMTFLELKIGTERCLYSILHMNVSQAVIGDSHPLVKTVCSSSINYTG